MLACKFRAERAEEDVGAHVDGLHEARVEAALRREFERDAVQKTDGEVVGGGPEDEGVSPLTSLALYKENVHCTERARGTHSDCVDRLCVTTDLSNRGASVQRERLTGT